MTVKTLHTFTDQELQLVETSLRIARDHFRTFADVMRRKNIATVTREYDQMADAAGELAMRIETSR